LCNSLSDFYAGIKLIVDERGFICSRDDIKSTGCCNIQAENTHIYYCETCDDSCCEIYENCVSCCLNPDNVSQQRRVTLYDSLMERKYFI
jgi:hypothetical protein